MESTLQELILQAANPDTVQQATIQLQQMLQDPNIIPSLINLFSQSDSSLIRSACLTFLHQIIKANWSSFQDGTKCDFQNFILSLFSQQIEPQHIQMICSMAGTIYSKESGQWDQIVTVIMSNWQEHPFIASQLLVAIIDDFTWENNENSEDFAQRFLEMDSFFITSSDTQIQIAGLRILSSIIGSITNYEGLPNFINMANQIAANSINENYTSNDFTSIWNSISAIMATLVDIENQEGPALLNVLTQTAVQIASNRNIESTQRILPITAIVNEISSNNSNIDNNMIVNSLNLVIDVIAQTIEETNNLPFDLLDLVKSFFKAQPPRGEIYNLISSKIFEALNSASVSHQASGLLILQVLLVDAQDCSHKDASKIADIIMKAVSSGNPLLVQASASVVEVFDETFKSMNIFSVDLLQSILPFTVHPLAEVRHHCLRASLIASDILDTEIPNFFKTVWDLYKKSSSDDMTLFFTLIANSIKYTPEFDDEDVEACMGLLQTVFQQKQDLTIFASSLTIVHALISFDSQLSDDLFPAVLPSLGPCLEYENSEVLLMTVSFLSNCITFFRESGIQIIVPFVQRLLTFITNPATNVVTDNVRSESLITLSRLVKHSALNPEIANFDYKSLLPALLTTTNEFLGSDSAELQISASTSIRSLAKIIDEKVRFDFFEKLGDQIKSNFELSVIQESIQSIARLLKVSEGKSPQMTEMAVTLLTAIIEGKVAFLMNDKQEPIPLIQIDTVVILFRNICKLITALISVNSPITENICQFLLQFLQRDSELDKSVAIGALSDAILYDAASPELCQSIVNSVLQIMPTANDPGLQENIIYLFNVCIIKQSQLIPSIMNIIQLFVNWWNNANSNQSGYSDVIDNLSSLFLALAITCDNFPSDLLGQVFDVFPRSDNDSPTIAQMCRNIISFVSTKGETIDNELQRKIALAIARLFMLDKLRLSEMQIDNELQKQLQDILVSILRVMPQVRQEISQIVKKSRAKARRLQSILAKL